LVRPQTHQSLALYAYKIWHVLTMPSTTIQNSIQRRQAQFLAAVLMILVPFAFVTTIIQEVAFQDGTLVINRGFWITVATIIIGVIIYVLSRTRY